jgi:hypothetical protein
VGITQTWGRFMSSLSAFRATWGTYGDPLRVFQSQGYDDYEVRLPRYAICEALYSNTIYKDLAGLLGTRIKQSNNLYRHIRSVRNPVRRLVDLYPALVYPGGLDTTEPAQGAIPLVSDNDALKAAIAQLWIWSNWGVEKPVYVRTGATFGDVFINVVDDPQSGRVWMEVLEPQKVRHVDWDARRNIDGIVIEYERVDEPDVSQVGIGYSGFMPTRAANKAYTYTMVISQDWFETYRDGQPAAFVTDAGQPVPRWPNTYGFIPVVHAPHRRLLNRFGLTSFHGTVDKIHELNDLASHAHDQLRNAVDIIWYFAGVNNPGELDFGEQDAQRESRRDKIKAVYGPKDSLPHPMIANVAIGEALDAVDRQLEEVVRDMPELSMHQAREQMGDVSGVAIENMYSDANGLISEAQGNYDAALIRAHMMGVTIGAMNRYAGFEAFNERSYERGDLFHEIKPRPVFKEAGLSDADVLGGLERAENVPDELLEIYLDRLGIGDAKQVAQKMLAGREQQRMMTLINGLTETDNANGNSDTTTASGASRGAAAPERQSVDAAST